MDIPPALAPFLFPSLFPFLFPFLFLSPFPLEASPAKLAAAHVVLRPGFLLWQHAFGAGCEL